MKVSRRSALLGLAGMAAGANVVVVERLRAQTASRGCLIDENSLRQKSESGANIDIVNEHIVATTGNTNLDLALGRALVRIAELFGETPGFGFYHGYHSSNAYASSHTRIDGTWGTVLFGRNLFEDLLRRYDDDGLSILAVAAHEFGHISQFKRNAGSQLLRHQRTVKPIELHADYLAGYYLGVRKRVSRWISVRDAGEHIYRIGDYEFNDPDHHGTPDERIAAAETGFRESYENGADFRQAFSLGMRYVIKNTERDRVRGD